MSEHPVHEFIPGTLTPQGCTRCGKVLSDPVHGHAESGDSKYGRLFTEDDVRKLLRYAAHRGEEVGIESLGRDAHGHRLDPGARLLVEYEAEAENESFPLRLTFPLDEPLFLLRGQDVASPGAIAGYYSAVVTLAPGAHADAVLAAYRKMLAWQQANADKVKVPD